MFYESLPGHKRGILFFVAVCVLFMQAGIWASRRRAQDNFPDDALVPKSNVLPFVKSDNRPSLKEHPIPKLMLDAENNFRQLLSRQSKTLKEAVAEYKRRYKRDTPPGFDDWWRFVEDNDVLMKDECDAILEDLAPFWELSPEELRKRAALVGTHSPSPPLACSAGLQSGHLPSIDLVRVRNGKSRAVNIKDGPESSEVSARAKGFLRMIEKFQEKVSRTCLPRSFPIQFSPPFPSSPISISRSIPWRKAVYLSPGNIASSPI